MLAVDVTTLPTSWFTALTRVAQGTRVYLHQQPHHVADAANSLVAFLAAGPLGADLDNDVGAASWLCLVAMVAAVQLLIAAASLPVPGRLMVAVIRALRRGCAGGRRGLAPTQSAHASLLCACPAPRSAGLVVVAFVGLAVVSVGAVQLLFNVGDDTGSMVTYLHVVLVGLPDGLTASDLVSSSARTTRASTQVRRGGSVR